MPFNFHQTACERSFSVWKKENDVQSSRVIEFELLWDTHEKLCIFRLIYSNMRKNRWKQNNIKFLFFSFVAVFFTALFTVSVIWSAYFVSLMNFSLSFASAFYFIKIKSFLWQENFPRLIDTHQVPQADNLFEESSMICCLKFFFLKN